MFVSAFFAKKRLKILEERNHKKLLREMISFPSENRNDNNFLIKFASKSGIYYIVEMLLKEDFSSIILNGALVCACEKGHRDIAKLLLRDKRVDPSMNGSKALYIAVLNNHVDLVKLLIRDGRVNPHTNTKDSPFLVACMNNRLNIANMLIDYRILPKLHAEYMFRWAVECGRDQVVKLLLEWTTVDPSKDSNRYIQHASFHGYYNIVKMLLKDKRVDPSVKNNALHMACLKGNHKIVKILLKDPRVDPSSENSKAIVLATQGPFGKYKTIKLLLKDTRIDPNVDNYSVIESIFCETDKNLVKLIAFHPRVDVNMVVKYALRNDVYDIVCELIKSPKFKADFLMLRECVMAGVKYLEMFLKYTNIDPSTNGNDAIKLASDLGKYEVVKFLLEDKRVSPHAEDNYAIRTAVKNDRRNVVKLLMNDPRVDPSDYDNQSLKFALWRKNFTMVKILLKDKRVDPKFDNNRIFRDAVKYGYIDIVKILFRDHKIIPDHETYITLHNSWDAFNHKKNRECSYILMLEMLTKYYLNDQKQTLINVGIGMKHLNIPVLLQLEICDYIIAEKSPDIVSIPMIKKWNVLKMIKNT